MVSNMNGVTDRTKILLERLVRWLSINEARTMIGDPPFSVRHGALAIGLSTVWLIDWDTA